MADIDSTLISNRAATPRVANEPYNDARIKTTGVGIVEVTTSTDAADEIRFCRVRSNAVIKNVLVSSDAAITSGAMDIGIYRTDDDGGAVVDADFFASALAVGSGLTLSNATHESAVYGIEDRDKPLWEALGLSADSQVWYDVVGTVTTDMGAGGTICLEVEYVDGGA
jgi:hypothetical protein